jgi:2-dehydro-3-deoxyphosphogluconate aldolase/(4S)-4-hydroxy-2-oxoglutarate aldolase
MSNEIYEQLGKHKLIPVIALDEAAQAAPLGDALLAGGLPVAEVTFRTAAAAESIRILADRGDLLVGAGTVLTTEQLDQAVAAGAKFIIAPGFNPKVVNHAINRGVPVCPGVATPSDIEQALEHGLEVVKFFPAEAFGGLATLKAIAAPYKQMRFVPTGGIGPDNVCDYLAFDRVVACGGSWMVKPSLYAGGDFGPVQKAVAEAVGLVSK